MRAQLPQERSQSHCPTHPHGNRLSRPRLSRGTARSRTEQRKCPGAAARPREAIGAKKTREKLKIGAKGVRGGNLQAEFCHPGRSLVLSRGRESTCSTIAYQQRSSQPSRQVNSLRLRSVGGDLTNPPPSRGRLVCFLGVGSARVIFSFAAMRAVSRIRGILERRVLPGAAARGRDAVPVPCQGLRGPGPRKGLRPLTLFIRPCSLLLSTNYDTIVSSPTQSNMKG